MKVTSKTDQDIVAGVAKWALKKLEEDWDQPIAHDLLEFLDIGDVRDSKTDLKGSGVERLESVLKAFITTNEKIAAQVATVDQHNEKLRAFFGKICNKENWKYPIDAIIRAEDEELAVEAIVFMTGGGNIITCAHPKKKGMIRIKAPGYYATVGA